MRRTAFELLSRLPRRVSAGGARWFVRGGRRRRAHAAISTLVRDNEVTVRRGHLAGLRLVATGSSAGYLLGSTEPVVQDALVEQLQPGKSFYDIGANVGFFTVLAARLVGRAGKVLAFEPLASNRAVLERNVALNRLENVMVLACAAAAASRPGWLSPRDGITASLTDGGRPGDIPIEIVAIDDLVCAAALPAPDVVKLDVEGHEIDALRGMLWTLRRFALAVIAEIHDEDGRSQIVELLECADYVISELSDPPGAIRHVLATLRRAGPLTPASAQASAPSSRMRSNWASAFRCL